MSVEGVPRIWRIQKPSRWPDHPDWMSYSTLTEIEACPRRWALKGAVYEDLWDGRGYPSRPHESALAGTIVHRAIERIARELAKRGCESLHQATAVQGLKELGGYTAIVEDCVDRVLLGYVGNPRAEASLESLRRSLTLQISELRSRVQRQVSRIKLAGVIKENNKTNSSPDSRCAVSAGSYAELELRAPDLGWRGFVDMLTVSDASCEIRDFKTGSVKDEHEFQLQVYALLWQRDTTVNPAGRLAESLVVSYATHDVEVAVPRRGALAALESELEERTRNALALIQSSPPLARPSSENCTHCAVRHLCDAYWDFLDQEADYPNPGTKSFADVEMVLTSRHGPTSWDGILRPGRNGRRDIVLRTEQLRTQLRRGQRVRVLNVHLGEQADNDANSPVVATMVRDSEMFVVPE